MPRVAAAASVARLLLACVFVSISRPAATLERQEGKIGDSQAIGGQSVWRAFACMAPFTASDSTQLFMIYGGTADKDARDPLGAADKGLGELRIYDPSAKTWYAPTTANAPSSGPVLPGCGAASDSIWVYDPHYGAANEQATTVRLLDSAHWSWSSPTLSGQLPVTRFGAAFAYVPSSQSFYMHGGIPLAAKTNTADSPPGIANNMDYLDPTTLAWSYASNGPARKYHTLCYMSSIESLVLFGGSDQNIASYNDIKVFSVKNNGWKYSVSIKGSAPAERILHSAVCSEDTMYMFGGTHSISDTPSDSMVWMLVANGESNFTWSKAPISGSSQSVGPTARAGHSAALYDNNMYIFGGAGPSSQDSAMYKLDLKSWVWSSSNVSGDETSGGGGINTRVLVAAVVSSVLGIVCVGIATFGFYRWNRRRGQAQDPPHLASSDRTLPSGDGKLIDKAPEYSGDSAVGSPDEFLDADGNGRQAAQTATAIGVIGTHFRGSGDYYRQYEDPAYAFDDLQATVAQHRRTGDIVANNYLPPPHSNPSLGSSVGSYSSPASPQAGPTAPASARGGGMATPATEEPSLQLIGGMSASNMPRHTATTSPAAIVGAIIASGQPIPTWLREAAIQPPVGDPSENVDMPLSSSSARVIDTHPVQRLEHAPGSKERLDKGNERASVYSNSTSGMHSTYTPIKYVDVSRSSTEETGSVCRRLANEAGEGIGMIIPARHRRQKSDSSGANTDSYSLPEALAFGASSLEGIAQPLAPPVPPHMNSLYGELGSRGIVVGQARLPQAAVAAVGHAVIGASAPVALPTNSCPSSAHAPDTASEYSILSPLDRLAHYHGLDDWMSADARQTSLSPQQRESSESDNTSSIYAARPIRRSADGL